jgi:uncharacterized protein (TIGR02147 family)
MNNTLPNIFDYNDFREYLGEYQKVRQKNDPFFTKTEICRRLGIPNTRSYFQDIVENRRPLTAAYVNRFIEVLELNPEQAQFFRCLVNFNQASEPGEREMYFDQLVTLNRTPVRKIDLMASLYYKEWYHSVIRALLEVHDFKDDHTALARLIHPPITEKQARQSITLLRDLKLIEKNAEGFYKPTDKTIATSHFLKDELVKNYQIRCLHLAQRAIVQNTKKPQSITTRTISVSEEGYKRIEKRIQKFSSEIRSLVHKDERVPDRVYHLDIVLFPVSR